MKLITLKEVVEITRLSKATIYRRILDSGFPKNISLGGNSVVWLEREVHDWLKSRIAMRDTAG